MQGLELPLTNCVWIKTAPGAPPTSEYSAIKGSENLIDYKLVADDVDCYISFRHAWVPSANGEAAVADNVKIIQAQYAIGPVTAGPARLLDLRVVGMKRDTPASIAVEPESVDGEEAEVVVVNENGVLQVGYYAMAKVDYIGGTQGASEFWWLKTNPDGRREELTSRTSVVENSPDLSHVLDLHSSSEKIPEEISKDPRFYKIKPEDLGCTLKVKCCPVRLDGYKGEVCTSKPSKAIQEEPQDEAVTVTATNVDETPQNENPE